MARIKGKDIYLKDDDQIYFGDNQEAAIWYDENDELRLSHTISGTEAIEDYHLVQKGYVDDALASGIESALPPGLAGQSLVRDQANQLAWERRATEEFSIAMAVVFGGR